MNIPQSVLALIENASELPLVKSAPLIKVNNFVYSDDFIKLADAAERENDQATLRVLDALEALSDAWGFYPDLEFIPNTAYVNFEAVKELIEATYAYHHPD